MREALRIVHLIVVAVRWGARPSVLWCVGRPMPVECLAVRLRYALQDMGLIFVKLGQYLSMRLDLLPAPVCEELTALYADVPAMSFDQVARQIEADLGVPWPTCFQNVEPTPVAGASIAQVHRAIASDGQVVALKVQRTGIGGTLEVDLRLLRHLAGAVDWLGLLNAISARQIVREIGESMRRELDFVAEGHNASRLQAQASPGISIPEIRWDLSGPHVLAMTFVEGPTLLEFGRSLQVDGRRFSTADIARIVDRLGFACFHQIFVTGHLHGDPHPANIIVQPDGGIAFVDFGTCAELDTGTRMRFTAYVERIALGKLDEAFGHLSSLITPCEATDRRGFRQAAIAIMRDWYEASSSRGSRVEARLAVRYQGRMLDAMRRHQVQMPPNQLLFWRVLAELDATAQRLPVDFDLLSAMRAFFAANTSAPQIRIAGVLDHLLTASPALAAEPMVEPATRRASEIVAGSAPLAVQSRFTRNRPAPEDRWVAALVVSLVVAALLAVLLGRTLPSVPPGGPADSGCSLATVGHAH